MKKIKKILNPIYQLFAEFPLIAENGDEYGKDNDGDGVIETVYVKGYYTKEGDYVRSHFRSNL